MFLCTKILVVLLLMYVIMDAKFIEEISLVQTLIFSSLI